MGMEVQGIAHIVIVGRGMGHNLLEHLGITESDFVASLSSDLAALNLGHCVGLSVVATLFLRVFLKEED